VGSELGIPTEKIEALEQYVTSPLYSEVEKLTLEYADRMTITDQDISDEFFARLKSVYTDDQIIELTAVIAWENSSSKFNRALRVPSQQLWRKASNPS
jgi:alkylhydroperoxidase family enzyme